MRAAVATRNTGGVDDDGILTVETTRNLRLGETIAFLDAWEEIGYQSRMNVQFRSLENERPIIVANVSIMVSGHA